MAHPNDFDHRVFTLFSFVSFQTGLQTKAWKKVADEHGFLVDSSELFRLASIHRAAAAVHRVFMWTLDNFEWERIADTHRTALDEVFNAWLESDGNFVSATSDRNTEPTQPSDEDVDALDVIVWEKLADKLGKTRPTEDEVNLVIKSGWVEGVRDVLGWTSDEKEIDGIISDCGEMWDAEHALLIKRYDEEHSVGASDVQLQQGVKEWLATLRDGEIPCAVMSFLDADQLDTILRITGLDDYFPPDKRVSASNTYPTVMDEMLGSALRVERLPNHCVVFDNAPTSANDAHEVQMKSVSFVDHYNKYDLTAADSTFEGLWDLDLMLMRKFFVERTDLELQLDLDTASAMEKKPTLTKTA